MRSFAFSYRPLLPFGLLLLFLLATPVCAQAQGKVDKVLENKKQKRKKRGKNKAQRNAKKARGSDGTQVFQAIPPLSTPADEGRSGGRYKPKSNGMRRAATPLRRSGAEVDPGSKPRMLRTRPGRAGDIRRKQSAAQRRASSPSMPNGANTYVAPEPLIERPKPGEKAGGKRLRRKKEYYRPEIGEGDKLMRNRPVYPGGNDEGLYSGNRKVKKRKMKEPGTHYTDRKDSQADDFTGTAYEGNQKVRIPKRRPGNPYTTPKQKDVAREGGRQGTIFGGHKKVHKSEVSRPGVHHSDRNPNGASRYSSSDATVYEGRRKVKRNQLSKPGTHYSDRSDKRAREQTERSGTLFSGKQKIRKSEVNEPGTYERPSRRAAQRVAERQGTGFSGHLKSRLKNGPGTHHSDRKFDAPEQNRQAGVFSGHQKIKYKNAPGTHHSDRKPDAPEQNRQAGVFSGNQKVRYKNAPGTLHSERKPDAPKQNQLAGDFAGHKKVKKSAIAKPGTHYSDRSTRQAKQRSSYAAARYGGNIKVPSRASQKRQYEQLSKKVHQFEGNIRLRYNKKNMHPSVADQKAKRYNQEQQARLRKLHHWWSGLWKKNADQPQHVKEKKRRPRYDRDEGEIWNE